MLKNVKNKTQYTIVRKGYKIDISMIKYKEKCNLVSLEFTYVITLE